MATLGTFISWIVFGLVIGLIARFLYPGPQPMGVLSTILLGVAGSLTGGLISWALGYSPELVPFRNPGWIMSILGAMLLVFAGLRLGKRPTRPQTPIV
jgi:uncharacterized membrane protein YeaQ/YmgE (transglycosylase-associated protein family)